MRRAVEPALRDRGGRRQDRGTPAEILGEQPGLSLRDVPGRLDAVLQIAPVRGHVREEAAGGHVVGHALGRGGEARIDLQRRQAVVGTRGIHVADKRGRRVSHRACSRSDRIGHTRC